MIERNSLTDIFVKYIFMNILIRTHFDIKNVFEIVLIVEIYHYSSKSYCTL